MRLAEVMRYYSREDIQQAMLSTAKGREVAGVFRSGEFGKRPNMIVYPSDIMAMVRSGVLEFHNSIERWSNPMNIRPENYGDVRSGWDIVLDLDCKAFEHGRIAAGIFCKALEKHGISNYSLKFTGGTGFHIGIPWNAIPRTIDYKDSVQLFPDLPRSIGLYIKEFVRDEFERALLKAYSVEELADQTKKPFDKLLHDDRLDPFQIVDVDPILISPRHLFRMPYSLNKKTWFVSLPMQAADLDGFKREHASPDKIKPVLGFLETGEEGEASLLISEAIDWTVQQQREAKKRKHRERPALSGAIPEEYFPQCIRQILAGLSDGRKRSLFILLTFLRSVGWAWPEIEAKTGDWNLKNTPPLPDNYLRSQLRWHKQQNKKILPPNFAAKGWYMDFGISDPESGKLVNPVNVAMRNFYEKRKK